MIALVLAIIAVGIAFMTVACLIVGSRSDRRDDE